MEKTLEKTFGQDQSLLKGELEFFKKFLRSAQSNVFDQMNSDIITDEGEL